MLSDNKVFKIFYTTDAFCKLFNKTVKNIPLMTQRGIETNLYSSSMLFIFCSVSRIGTFCRPARSNNPDITNTTGWFFPSVKKLHMLCYKDVADVWNAYESDKLDTKNAVNTSLEKVNGTKFGGNYYWSSSEDADFEYRAFDVNFCDGDVYGNRKGNGGDYVRRSVLINYLSL